MTKKHWSMQQVWNETLAAEQSAIQPRDYIRGSDIGKNYWERWQKMKGVPFTKDYDARILRVFSAGIWFEDMIGHVLNKIGIVQSTQDDLVLEENEKHLKITGHPDFIIGGLVNWDVARKRVNEAGFPEFIVKISMELIKKFESEYPDGLEDTILETKTVNSMLFWSKKDYLEEAYPHHTLQLYTYLKIKNIKRGVIGYISKDDLTIEERIVILGTERIEDAWNKDVEEMSAYYRDNIEPPKPESIVFDPRKKLHFQHEKVKHTIKGCYVPNWEVKWSSYFELLTGFKTEDQWLDSIKLEMKTLNETMKDAYKVKLLEKKPNPQL